jgi:hypothetical protein
MGVLNLIDDPTGSMSQEEINSSNIGNIVTELNRNADQLDSLSKSLAISSKGSVPASLSSSVYSASVDLGTTVPSSFIAYMQRSDDTSKYYSLPYMVTTGTPVSGISMAVSASLTVDFAGKVSLSFLGVTNGVYAAPASLTFFYYTFNQPTNPTTT